MTIKSDRWIRQHCVQPEYEVTQGDKHLTFLSPPYSEKEQRMINHWNRVREAHGGSTVSKMDEVVVTPYRRSLQPMIEPFVADQVRNVSRGGLQGENEERVISFGNSSYGYDARCADEFKIFTNINNAMVDPKNFTEDCLVNHQGDHCIIPPNSFALARTVEYFRIPEDTLVVCLGKSTYARCGIIVNVTPLEPGWEGHVTLEFSNTTNLPAKIYANEGVCQFLFFQSDERCDVSYKDRGGKYMGQRGVTNPRL